MTTIKKIFYNWIAVGDIEVEVGDIEDDEDETAIMQQLYMESCLRSRRRGKK